jgi:hypothetical protein
MAYYWCLTHGRVEQGTACPATERMGPYDTPEAARDWRDRVESRAEAWQVEDDRWKDDDEDDEDDDGW